MNSWSLAEALVFANSFREFLIPLGFDIALTRSVLTKGFSEKDIDIIIYPLKKISSNYTKLLEELPKFGLKYIRLPNHNKGYQDDGKNVQVWEYKNKRADLFFWS
jgi:hypothetical protein